MRCHLATAVTIQSPRPINPVQAVARFITRPLSDGLTLADHLIAGAVASAAATIAVHPMDTLKTLTQRAATSTAAAAATSTNALGTFVTTLRTQGPGAFYRGLSPSLAGQVPSGAIKFAAYETLTQFAHNLFPNARSSAVVDYTCAALAFVVCSVAYVPGELIKQRLQAGVYPNVTSALTNMIRKEGVRTMYTGYGATLLRDVPYTMLEFGLYAQFKRSLRYILRKEKLTPTQELTLGGLAGGVTGFFTTPLDLAKTRLMTQPVGVARQYHGVVDTIVKVARNEGVPALFKGSSARVLWLVPFTAVYFGAHEASKRLLASRKRSIPFPHADSQKSIQHND